MTLFENETNVMVFQVGKHSAKDAVIIRPTQYLKNQLHLSPVCVWQWHIIAQLQLWRSCEGVRRRFGCVTQKIGLLAATLQTLCGIHCHVSNVFRDKKWRLTLFLVPTNSEIIRRCTSTSPSRWQRRRRIAKRCGRTQPDANICR